jgi:tetratricopeptide (TPR) repeat protein
MTDKARRAARLLIEESRRHRKEGRYREAAGVAISARRIATDEKDAELIATAFYEEGQSCLYSDDYRDAVTCATLALSQASGIPAGAKYIIGNSYVLWLSASLEVVEMLLSTKLELADEAEAWVRRTGKTSFRSLLLRKKARILADAERYQDAIWAAEEALAAARSDVRPEAEEQECMRALAFVEEAAGNWQAVRDRCETILNNSNMDRWSLFDVHGLCARSARNMGDVETAFSHARRCVELARGDNQRFLVWALRDLYSISVVAQTPLLDVAQEMVATATGIVEKSPEEPILWAELGHALKDVERYEEALAAYTRATELALEKATYHNNQGDTLYELKRYEEALAAYTRATELAPEKATYHNNRGLALSKLDRYEDELAAVRQAAELAPENAVYHNNVGNALYSLGHYEEALPAYTRATELAPENATYHNNLTYAQQELERQICADRGKNLGPQG